MTQSLAIPSLGLLPVVLLTFPLLNLRTQSLWTWASFATVDSPPILQGVWEFCCQYPALVSHFLFPSVLAFAMFILSCVYFTVKDLSHDLRTKTQPEHFPTIRDMCLAGIPQIVIYSVANGVSWVLFPRYIELPALAPTLPQLLFEMTICFLGGDFLIYVNHRIMHVVPYLRNHVHSVHHKYHHPFSWAGGWVHPIEDLIVVGTQVFVPLCVMEVHPLSFWVFVTMWVAFLIEEHSGHDVWWSPWSFLPFGWGGGAVPHDIHHVKPTKNFGFVLTIWDRMFGTHEEPKPRVVPPTHQGPIHSLAVPLLSWGLFVYWLSSVHSSKPRESSRSEDIHHDNVKLPYGVW